MNEIAERSVAAGSRERLRIRAGEFSGTTAGLAPGNVQANLVILPKTLAHDFLRFAQANPKPCPVLAVSGPGDPRLPGLGEDLDIRSDLPRYRVWRRGELVEEPLDLFHVWRDDLVSFALGCSFSFEQALLEDGIELVTLLADRMSRCIGPISLVHRPVPLRVHSSSRCGRSSRTTRSARSRSLRGSPRCTARRSISACRRRSASRILPSPITATRFR